jgi:hypothetical protein
MKHEWKTVEQLEQELEFFIVSKAPQWIIEEAAVTLGAARIRDEIDQEIIDTFLGEV